MPRAIKKRMIKLVSYKQRIKRNDTFKLSESKFDD